MEFSDRTKLVFADSMKQLMARIPLDRITVMQIVENCGATRQTFYRSVAQANGAVPGHIQFLLEFYCHGSMDMTVAWVHGGMQEPPSAMADRLIEAMPEKLRPYLSSLSRV